LSKVCFVDNDVLLKIVACNLLKEAIELLELERQNIKFLGTAKKVIKRNRKVQKKYSIDIRDRAINIIDESSKITVQPENLEKAKILEKVNDIDPGEAILLAATLEESAFF
jgi:hypothetical protein